MVIIGPISVAEENLLHQVDECQFELDKTCLGNGALYITENSLCWKEHGKDEGISIPWTKISVHAISNTPQRCIYLLLDFLLVWPGVTTIHRNGNGLIENEPNDGDDEDEGHVEDEDQEISEILILPANTEEVDKIYNSIVQCQMLHPDTDNILSDEDDDDDDDDEFMEALDENGQEETGEEQLQNLSIEDSNRFADAEED